MKCRNSKYLAEIRAGTPQGDPMSTLLFMGAFNPVIVKLKEKYGVIAYADDIILIVEQGKT